jgi:hypothetical protein
MLGVVEDLAAGSHDVGHRVADHGEILLAGDTEHLGHMKSRGLAHDHDDGRGGGEQGLHAGVIGRNHAPPPGHAEGHHLRMPQADGSHPLEKLRVLGIRERVAPFDVVHAHFVEPPGDGELVFQGEVHPFSLAAVAERGVVDFYRAHNIADRGAIGSETHGRRLVPAGETWKNTWSLDGPEPEAAARVEISHARGWGVLVRGHDRRQPVMQVEREDGGGQGSNRYARVSGDRAGHAVGRSAA